MKSEYVIISPQEMQSRFYTVLTNLGFKETKALQCAEIFTTNSLDGVYTHGVNRFPKFVQYVKNGYIKINAEPSIINAFGGIEQWNGNLGPGVLNALHSTDQAMKLAQHNGIGCVALSNTNHWMRAGYYAWQASKKGFVFIAWTNTIANMPAWNAVDNKLGNNPIVLSVPYKDEAIVLDMAMSQFSYGALEMAGLKNEKLPVNGGYDINGKLSIDPSAIFLSKRLLPTGYWKGAGFALLLDLLSVILSGGLATHEITKQKEEYGLSQVFICIDINKLIAHSVMANAVENIIKDYHQSVSIDNEHEISYPGERILAIRKKNATGIPVLKTIWNQVNDL